jgi:membrane-bound ClpP family serine protease
MSDKRYSQYILSNTYYGNAHALAFVLIAQVIYLNFHYIVGGTVILLGCVSLVLNLVMSFIERYYMKKRLYETLDTVLNVHFYLSQCIMAVFIGIMIWEIVYMYQHQHPDDPELRK